MAGVEGRGEGWEWQGQRYEENGVETSTTGELPPMGTMKSPGLALMVSESDNLLSPC